MEGIKATTLKRAITLLDVVGVQYAIIDLDGVTHGNLKIVPVKAPTPKRGFRSGRKYGDLARIYRPVIDTMQVGDVQVIPLGEHSATELGSATAAYCNAKWGAGSYTYETRNKAVEILRIS